MADALINAAKRIDEHAAMMPSSRYWLMVPEHMVEELRDALRELSGDREEPNGTPG